MTRLNSWCAQIGSDSLLVQGPGGNVSWKEEKTLWIKASGTCLSEAQSKDIFIPVDLTHLQKAIAHQDFSVVPHVLITTELRPSIETLLHALMPYKLVIHLHAVEVLAHLVRKEALLELTRFLKKDCSWVCVDYHQPGSSLADAVQQSMARQPQVIFLKNHGLVFGASTLEEADQLLKRLIDRLKTRPRVFSSFSTMVKAEKKPAQGMQVAPLGGPFGACVLHAPQRTEPTHSPTALRADAPIFACQTFFEQSYRPCSDHELHQLALNKELLNRVKTTWALYPDHVVFLGPRAVLLDDRDDFRAKIVEKSFPPFVFLPGRGVWEHARVNRAQAAQLRCYYDVLVRQKSDQELTSLSNQQIAQLLNWEAEQFRQGAQV